MGSDGQERAVRRAVEPLLTGHDLTLERVEVRARGHRTVVRVTVDLADGPGSLGSDLLADVSREISHALDERDAVPGAYTLEVSTPGVDRPLTTPRHYRRAQGRLLRVRRAPVAAGAGVGSASELLGRVVRADEDAVVLRIGSGDEAHELTVPYDEVTDAVVEVELRRVEED